jgi:hypothetical protein
VFLDTSKKKKRFKKAKERNPKFAALLKFRKKTRQKNNAHVANPMLLKNYLFFAIK